MIALRFLLAAMLCPVAAHAGIVYASNFGNNTITAYDFATGGLLGTPVSAGPEIAGLNGLRVAPDGSFLVTGQFTNNVVRYDANGVLSAIFDPANNAGLNAPQALTFGPDGQVYVVSSADDRILKYDSLTGAYLGTLADLSSLGHIGPIDLAFDGAGHLYVSAFDNNLLLTLDAHTGAMLGSKQGPAGGAFAASALGGDGNLYVESIDLNTLNGSVYRYNPLTGALDLFIAEGTGGLLSPGGLAFGPDGSLMLVNLALDQNFNDAGSTLLRYDGATGAYLGTLVGPGSGLNVPFFIATSNTPEPPSVLLSMAGLAALLICSRPFRAG